jgi:hypothetical protein
MSDRSRIGKTLLEERSELRECGHFATLILARTNPENKKEKSQGRLARLTHPVYLCFLTTLHEVAREWQMKKSLWNSAKRQELHERLDLLTPNTAALWGQMSVSQMVAHLVDSLRLATGELVAKPQNLPIRFTPLKQLIIYGPPFPKNSPTSPELRARLADDWKTECDRLRLMMKTLAERPESTKFPRHPLFGEMSRNLWGVLSYKHIDHHFRQFGV